MKTRYIVSATLAIWLTVFGTVRVGAQSETSVQPNRTKKIDEGKLEALKAKIEQLKYEKMQHALALDDQSAQKFLQLYKPAEKDVQDLVKSRNEELKKLGIAMNGAKTDADVDPQLAKIRELNKKIEERQAKLDEDLKPILTSQQRARLMVFEHSFNTKLQSEIANRKMERQEIRRNIIKKHAKELTAAPHPGAANKHFRYR